VALLRTSSTKMGVRAEQEESSGGGGGGVWGGGAQRPLGAILNQGREGKRQGKSRRESLQAWCFDLYPREEETYAERGIMGRSNCSH
jgi:hypothetical protein